MRAVSRTGIDGLLSIAMALILLTGACAQLPGLQSSPELAAVTTEKPTVTPKPPPPEASAVAFLDGWRSADYGAMYTLLSPESQQTLDADEFTRRYRNALDSGSVITATTQLNTVLRQGERATAAYEITLDTALFGTLTGEYTMSLRLHDSAWRIDWDAGLIWPQLAPDNYFRTTYRIPVRENIYDRDGLGMATQGTIVTVGVIPGQIEDEISVLERLASLTGLSGQTIRGRYASANPEWKIPIADIPAEVSVEQDEALASLAGVYREEKGGRTYPHGEAVGHIVGWVAPVPAERLTEYRRQGYRGDEMVGVAGLEAWGEGVVAGQHGATLSVVTALGEPVTEVAHRDPQPGRAVYTTLDRNFQEEVQQLLGDRKGAVVVLDVKTGAVRALVSGPGFDPNAFSGPAGDALRSQILTDPRQPLFNRATQGTYPTGSVFKIVTMAAGMEAGGLDPISSEFDCPGYWDALGRAARKYCWRPAGHGRINLQDGLTGSCNVTFYNVGLALHQLDPEILPRYASEFGLGRSLGLEGLLTESGLMPDPEWKMNNVGEVWYPGDTVHLAIGQGYLRITPLQVAWMMSAVANGGTLYRPYIVERIAGNEWEAERVIEPEEIGSLPISAENLEALQEGLLRVTSVPYLGTATYAFSGLDIPVAGKTGTAEVGVAGAAPHSWFAAYAPADAPEIAVVAIVENAGEGSTVAAPLVRQVIEAYYGLPVTDMAPEAEENDLTTPPAEEEEQELAPIPTADP